MTTDELEQRGEPINYERGLDIGQNGEGIIKGQFNERKQRSGVSRSVHSFDEHNKMLIEGMFKFDKVNGFARAIFIDGKYFIGMFANN